ncbi:MAG: hypothetical protein WBF81_07280 [Thermoplasmata archaeon]
MGWEAFGRVPLPAVAAALALISFGIVALGIYLHLGMYWPVLLVLPLAIAAVYISQYSRRPFEPSPPRTTGEPATDEPFDDPVEEADRIEAAAPEGTTPPTDEAFDDPVEEADRLGGNEGDPEPPPNPDGADSSEPPAAGSRTGE